MLSQSIFSPFAFSGESVGIASWYSESDPGINIHTANGEVFEDTRMTCASWDYPFGTILRVTYLKNGDSIICRVNDRGPSKRLGRLVDLTKTGFEEMAPLRLGLIKVKVEKVEPLTKARAVWNQPEWEFPDARKPSALPHDLKQSV